MSSTKPSFLTPVILALLAAGGSMAHSAQSNPPLLAGVLQGRLVVEGQAPPADSVVMPLPQPVAALPRDTAGKPLGAAVGADGRFTVRDVAEGWLYLCLYVGGRLDAGSILRLHVEPGQTRDDLVLKAQPPRAKLELVLQSDNGKPLGRKVKVHLFNPYGAVDEGTWSDDTGLVTFERLPAGRYDLWLESLSGAAGGEKAGLDNPPSKIFHNLAVTSGADAQRLELKVPPSAAAQGRLLLADEKTPALGYVVAVQSATTPDTSTDVASRMAEYARGARQCYAETVVGADGSFVLAGLTPGEHALDIRRPDDLKPWFSIPVVAALADQVTKNGTWTVAKNGWQSMFDGKTLGGWKESDFTGRGEVRIENGQLILNVGNDMTGVTWTGDLPRIDYEVSLEARRVDGSDFFCGLTFPVEKSPLSLIVGGWGGTVVGISSLNGADASENETTKVMDFETGRWYRIRLRVTRPKIEAWIDDEQIIDLELAGKQLSIRIEVEPSRPFGFATWRTTGALRDIRIRRLDTLSEAPAQPAD
ncbi:MAG: DUF1080 domain-containing protein [Armatimonadota bacterium]|nr:DUF1080 domain-containing protein [Armatimonadota bacterium]